MNLQFFITVLIIFLIAYYFHNRDVLNPACIVVGVFVVCSYIAIYSSERLELDLSAKAYTLFVFGLLSFAVASVLVGLFFRSKYKSSNKYLNSNIEYIKIYNERTIVLICGIFFIVSCISQIKLAVSIGGSGLSNLIYAYRMEMLTGSDRIPSIVSNMETFDYAIGYGALYVLVNNLFVTKKIDYYLMTLVIFPSAIGILSGSRGEVIHYFIFFLIIYYYFYLIKKKKKHIDGKLLIKMALIFASIFLLVYFVKFLIGRQDQLRMVDYISGHLASPIKLFDLFVNESHSSSYWGEETFTRLLATIMKRTGKDIRYNTYATFRYINGMSLGNVYTAFRAYYADFGTWGVLIVPFCISLVSSTLYYSFRTHLLRRRTIINRQLFLYAYISYGLFMMFYSNQILEYMANVSFIKMLIVWSLFDYFCIRGKIKLKIRGV